MKIFNSLTLQKEEFVPLHPDRVGIYACGPTVYNLIHIGNARPLCVFDVLRRYLEMKGYTVNYVQNFTDVDDKIIRRANEEGITSAEVAEKYIREYKTDAKGLNVREATIHPKATESIGDIISLVQTLIDKGYAYVSGGDVYFRANKFEGYGKLCHQPMDELESGARVDVSDVKESPVDFALWKAAKPGEPSWESPWGQGRPGWHIECSAMALTHIGQTIDIHCGGSDLLFPHHENEIAQSESATGKPFARYWMHNGFINVDNKKMSKSLGNFFTVRDVAEKYGYEPIRFMMIAAHYRSPINYSVEIIEQAKAALNRLYTCRENLVFAASNAPEGEVSGEVKAMLEKRRAQFIEAMEDDLNTADALAALFELAKDINIAFVSSAGQSKQSCQAALEGFDELCDVLGLLYNRAEKTGEDAEIEALVAERTAAKKAKNFARADEIRNQLKERGILLEDTPQGTKWRRA